MIRADDLNSIIEPYFDDMLVLDVMGTGKLDLYEAPIKMNSVQKIEYVIVNISKICVKQFDE